MLFAPPPDLQAWYRMNSLLGERERYRTATLAEAYYLSRQYEGMPSWDDKSKPLMQRAPRVVLPLYKEAVDSIERFVWGGHLFPRAYVEPTAETAAADIGPLLDKGQADSVSAFVTSMVTAGKLRRAMREASRKALINTSAAILLGVRAGRLCAHVEPGKHCEPTFDPNDPRRIEELDIRYRYEREEQDSYGRWRTVEYWYRRTLTAEEDIAYVEQPVRRDKPPEWTRDPAKTVKHDLGFVPAKWIRTFPEDSDAVDGRPLIDPQIYPVLDEINRLVSQKGRAVAFGCDPQLVRTGVDELARDTLRKNPGMAWDLPKEADAKFIEISGDGATRAGEHLRELTAAFRDAVGYVKASQDVIRGNVTGIVLELLHRPMMAVASDLRDDLGDDGFVDVLNLALRIVATVSSRGKDVWIPGVRSAVPVLLQAQREGVWLDYPIRLDWPRFFEESAQEKGYRIDQAIKAQSARLISLKTAVRSVAGDFGVQDVDAELEAIEQERAEQADFGPMMGERRPPMPPPMMNENESEDEEAEEPSDA